MSEEEETTYGFGDEADGQPEDLTQWEPPKLPPPEQSYAMQTPALPRVRRGVAIGILAALGLAGAGSVGYALYKKPDAQGERVRLGKTSTERARLPEAIAALDAADKKQGQTLVSTGRSVDTSGVDPAWLNQTAKDPRLTKCDDLEDANEVVRCNEAKDRLENKYQWARETPPQQNIRGYDPKAYAANPNRDQEDESALEPPPMLLCPEEKCGGKNGQAQGGGQDMQAMQQPSMPSASPVMGLSPMQAHQMAQDMVGGQNDDPESQKEHFMAQGGIETLAGPSEDVGECDLSAGTPVHGSVMVAINSDLPAQNTVTVRVNKTVFCGADQRVTYGQERIQLCMKQLERPPSAKHPRKDRKQLGCFVVADIQGASGMPADVDNHWGAVIGGSLLSAVLSLGTTASMGNQEGFAPTVAQRAANAAGQNLNSAGQRIVQRDLARKPTLTTEQLEDVVILFSSNLVLDPWTPRGTGPAVRRVAAW
jgi:type IV secretory pathway VirB10-like protein